MKNFEIALRSLFKQGRSNGIKILSLGVGLAMGLVLISKVCFERSFDSFYPDSDRIYRLNENIDRNDQLKTYLQVSGAVAPGMKAEIPEVELATRLTFVGGDKELFTTTDKAKYTARYVLMADSNVFDVLPVPILAGNPKIVLARPGYVMISRSLADKMGGISKAIGQTFKFDSNAGTTYEVGGVFENIPENTHLRYEMLISLNGMNQWSLNNWLGNDRYLAYVKLYPGVDPESLKPAMKALLERHVDMNEVKKSGVDLTHGLTPLSEMHSDTDEVRNMNRMLLLLAFVLLTTAVLNYVLIVLSTLIGRSKEVAVHKCYGASDRNLFGMIMSETLLHMVLALVVAGFLILVCKDKVQELLDASLGALFTPETVVLLVGICLVVFFLTGLIPTYLFLRIPVVAAFRTYKESKRYWKLCLLFVQFAATAYLVSLLGVINGQYDRMINDNPGYTYENLFYYEAQGVEMSTRESLLQELSKLPEVEITSASYDLPMHRASGNNVMLPGDDRQLFNIADMYWVNDNFFQLMEISVIEGDMFRQDGSAEDKVMVSRSFAEKISGLAGWKDGVVGKSVRITEHSEPGKQLFTICGVYDDIRLGSIADAEPDLRPSVFFWGKKYTHNVLIKLREVSPENIQKVTDVIAGMMPDRDTTVNSYKMEMVNLYQESANFRDAILAGGLVTLIIALIGLLGYTADETSRRGREIAIRKVNGATAADILRMLSKDVSLIAIPALVIGITVARFSGESWLEQFAEKIPLDLPLFLLAALAVYLIIIVCVFIRAWDVANQNPVESVKTE